MEKEELRIRKETFNGMIEDLEEWIDSLEGEQLNVVLAYLVKKEADELKAQASFNTDAAMRDELDTLRTLANTVKIIEEAKVTGRRLSPLPFSLLDYIEAYEKEFGDLKARYAGETDENGG